MPVFNFELELHFWIQSLRTAGWLESLSLNLATLNAALLLLLVLVTVTIFKYTRHSFFMVSVLLLSVFLSHYLGHHYIKELFHRPRPEFLDGSCVGSSCYGFISSLVGDYSGAVAVLIFRDLKNAKWALPIGAFLAFTRLYVGHHFILDVVGGTVVGFAVGFTVWNVAFQLREYFVQKGWLKKIHSFRDQYLQN